MSPFPILGLLGGTFHFYSDFNRAFCKQTVENSEASDLGLYCLLCPIKKDARLIWVKPPNKQKTYSCDLWYKNC